MSDFGEGLNPVARKQHSCEWCHSPILVGEQHFRFSGKWQGEFQDWRMHSDCEDAHERETFEGEICERGHQRGRTCIERDEARRRFCKDLGQILKTCVEKGATDDEWWTRLGGMMVRTVEEWDRAEKDRVEKIQKAAKAEKV